MGKKIYLSKKTITIAFVGWLFCFLIVSILGINLLQSGPTQTFAQDEGVTFEEETVIDPGITFEQQNDPNAGATFEQEPVQYSPLVEYSPPQPPAPPTVLRSYPECAGSPGMVHDVDQMSDGTFRTYNEHFQAGACGDISNQQAYQPQSQPDQAVQQPPTVVRSYSECAGAPGMVHDVDQMSDGTYRTYNEHIQTGACGDNGADRDGGSVIRTYTECAGSPGRVRDVEQLSNGGYRTFNERYQAGACGDQVALAATPTPTPNPTFYETFRCDGNTQVLYRVYSDGRREDFSRHERSGVCGYQAHSTAFGQGASVFQTSSRTQYAALSANCVASPQSVMVNQAVNWNVYPTGGSGSFNYRWNGDRVDGQTSNSFQSFYPTPGVKFAQVQVTDRVTNNSVSTSCSVAIQENTPQTQFQPPVVTQFPSQITPQFQSTPQPQVVMTQPQSTAQCPVGTIESGRNGSQIFCQPLQNQITTTQTTSQCPPGTVERSRSTTHLECERVTTAVVSSNPAVITTSQPVITTTPVVTTPAVITTTQAQPTVVTAQQTVQCPAGTIEKSRTSSEIICERQVAASAPQQSLPTESKPLTVLSQSATPSIKELPKTGLPIAAIGFASLTPLGLRVKKLLKSREIEESANSIWLTRQMKSDRSD